MKKADKEEMIYDAHQNTKKLWDIAMKASKENAKKAWDDFALAQRIRKALRDGE